MPRLGFFGFWRTEVVAMKRRIGPMLKYSTKGNYCSRVRFHRTLETITMLTTFLQRASNHLLLPWVGKLPACSCSVMLTYNHYLIIGLTHSHHPIIGCKRDAGFAVNCSRSIDDERKHIWDTVCAAKRFRNSII